MREDYPVQEKVFNKISVPGERIFALGYGELTESMVD